MIKKVNDFLAGWPMTIVGGLCLIGSYVLPRIGIPNGQYLAWISVIICGIPLLYLSIWRIIHNKGISKISSALLISIAMIAAILIGDLFAAGEVAFIMAVGALLEDMTTERAKKGLKNLINLTPTIGRVIRDGKEYEIQASEIKKGDILRILPGETIPVDGVVISGETSVDQSIMTGESLPVDKTVNDTVFCGTINRFGSIDIEATKVGEDSSLQKLIKMIKDAEKNKAPTQRIADKWASWLVPVALLIAIITYVFTKDIVRAVTVLVVFCPCALVLATPTAIMGAIGQATKHGVIIKSGEALEKMGKINIIAFDKTGTLTHGNLEVSNIIPIIDIREEELLKIAASAEKRSEHPLAKAVVDKANKENITLLESNHFKMTSGKGVYAEIDGIPYHLGNENYINEIGINLDETSLLKLDELRKSGKASIIVGSQEKVIGIIGLSDVLRTEGKEIIQELKQMGTESVLLTGDNKQAAQYFASQVGITDIRADLLPENKVNMIEELMQNNKVCMIGDGINDAPALKTADVGVAMGVMGSDIAVEAADVALMSDDISKIPYLKWLGNETIKTIKIEITVSMIINFIAVSMSVMGVLTPTTGALVHNAGSVFVVMFAALLYDKKYKKSV